MGEDSVEVKKEESEKVGDAGDAKEESAAADKDKTRNNDDDGEVLEARLKDKLEGKQKEARLKDKLESKKKESELKNKLMAKKERRNSENEDDDSHNDRRGSNTYVPPHRRPDYDGPRREEGPRRGDNGPPRGDDRGPYIDRYGGGGRGGPGRGGGGYGRDYYDRDPYGRGGPPPPHHPHDRYGGGRGDRDEFGRLLSPHDFHRGPPRGGNHFRDQDPYDRAPPTHHRGRGRRSRSRSYSSRSRSLSRSRSRPRSNSRNSRSRSASRSSNKRARSPDRDRSRRRKHHRKGRRRSRSPSTSGSSVSSSASSSSSSSEESNHSHKNSADDFDNAMPNEDCFTKDQRTVFVNQLVMRTTERDIRRYFQRKVKAKVVEVTLLTDRRTGKHKGCAYVEMKSMDDVAKALNVSAQAPDFQRFPILVKPSEAEKNYLVSSTTSVTYTPSSGKVLVGSGMAPMRGPNGELVEAQKVYVGSLDPNITQEHLYKLFSQFGELSKVQLQTESMSGISKGFAFLSFRDPKDANLAIQTMSNQVLGGRPMKTGWATQPSSTPGVQILTSEEFPVDASTRAQKAHIALAQLAIGAGSSIGTPHAATGGGTTGASSANRISTVAEARQSLAATAAAGIMGSSTVPAAASPAAPAPTADAKVIGRHENPSQHLLIANMFDKDEETEPGWAKEIKEEFHEEAQKFGSIENILVMSNDPGGKIYASFSTIEAAKTCASSLAGRWFDKRQLRVDFVDGKDIPKHA